MKILFVNEYLGFWGGAEQNIAHLAKGFGDMADEPYLAFGRASPKDASGYSRLFKQVWRCEEVGGKGESFYKILQDCQPDVVFMHQIKRLPWMGKKPDLPVWRMVHDHNLYCPRKHKYFFFNERVCDKRFHLRCWLDLAFLSKRTNGRLKYESIVMKLRNMSRHKTLDGLIVASEFMKKQLCINGFSPEKIRVLPPCIPVQKNNDLKMTHDSVVLFVGQIIKGKGLDLLLKALSLIKVPFKAFVVGQGNAFEKMKTLSADLDLSQNVEFVGWVKPDQIHQYYEKARLVAVPSKWPEPFGMIGLEAMHHAKPVVAFDVGGVSQWLEHKVNGYLCKEQDIKEMAHAIEFLLQNYDLARQMGDLGRKKARLEFYFGDYLKKLRNLFE